MSNLLNIKLKKLAALLKDRDLHGEACEIEKLASYEALEKARHIWKHVVPTPERNVRHYVYDPFEGYEGNSVFGDFVGKHRVSFLWRHHIDPMKADLLHGHEDNYGSKQSVSDPSPKPPTGGAVRKYWGNTETIIKELARMVEEWREDRVLELENLHYRKNYSLTKDKRLPLPDRFLEDEKSQFLTRITDPDECEDNGGVWTTEINGEPIFLSDGTRGICIRKEEEDMNLAIEEEDDFHYEECLRTSQDPETCGMTQEEMEDAGYFEPEAAEEKAHKKLLEQVERAKELRRRSLRRNRNTPKHYEGVVEEDL